MGNGKKATNNSLAKRMVRGGKKNQQSAVAGDTSDDEPKAATTRGASNRKGQSNNKQERKKKNNNTKRRNLQKADDELRYAIEAEGTKTVIEMSADGNCLFRALSDQLFYDYGDHHVEVRDDVVEYMEENENDFVVFLVLNDKDSNDEDATDFASYCNAMRNDGTWGGNLELVAASKVYRRNITVYSSNLAAFTIHHDNKKGSLGPDLLLSYHDNDHYNSVRLNNMNGNKIVTASKLYERSNYHNNSVIEAVDASEKTDSQSDQTIDTSTGRTMHHQQQQLDDEMSTTDTESSRLSGNTAASSGTNTTATTAATGYSTSSTSTNMSTSSTCSIHNDCDKTQQQDLTQNESDGKPLSVKDKQKNKVKPEKKKRSISRINLLRGYHKVNSDIDDEDYDGERDSVDQISEDGGGTVQTNGSKSFRSSRQKKEKRKKDTTSTASSVTSSDDDDFVKKGHFRVLKI